MNNLRIVRPSELAKILSVSKPTLWRMEKRGELPSRIKLSKSGRAVGWRLDVIEDWIETRGNDEKE